MTDGKPLLAVENWKPLIQRVSRLSEISRYGDSEAEALVHALSDLEDSYRRYLDEELPGLLRENLSDDELLDALWEIGEGMRHIAYHLYQPDFFRTWAEDGRRDGLEAKQEDGSGQ
jgi:hypothetical protein